MLLARPCLQQLVTSEELGTLHVGVPRGMTRKTPVEMALGARHHQAVLVCRREDVIVDR